MNTVFLLMAEYETSQVPLSVVADKFLNMSSSYAERKANLGELPFPTYKDVKSQKTVRMVHIVDLAEWIDAQRKIAKKEMKLINER